MVLTCGEDVMLGLIGEKSQCDEGNPANTDFPIPCHVSGFVEFILSETSARASFPREALPESLDLAAKALHTKV